MWWSAGLPKSSIDRDQAVSARPHTFVAYRPDQQPGPILFDPAKQFGEGLRYLLEMQNKAGYLRREYYQHALYVQKVSHSRPNMMAARKKIVSDEGDCYIVANIRTMWREYSRDEQGASQNK